VAKLELELGPEIDRNLYVNAMLRRIRDEELLFYKSLKDLELLLTKDNTLSMNNELFHREMDKEETRKLTSAVQRFYDYFEDVAKVKNKVVAAYNTDKKTGSYTECDINAVYRDHIHTSHPYYKEFTLLNEIRGRSAEILDEYETRISKRLNEILKAEYNYSIQHRDRIQAVNGCYYNAKRRRWTLLIAARPSEIKEVQNLKLWRLQKALDSVNDEYGTAFSYRGE